MSFWVLTKDGRVLSQTTVQYVTNLELSTTENVLCTTEFTTSVPPKVGSKTNPSDWIAEYEFDEEFTNEFHNVIDITNNDDANDAFTPDVLVDTYLNMELSHRVVVVRLNSLACRNDYMIRTDWHSQ